MATKSHPNFWPSDFLEFLPAGRSFLIYTVLIYMYMYIYICIYIHMVQLSETVVVFSSGQKKHPGPRAAPFFFETLRARKRWRQ